MNINERLKVLESRQQMQQQPMEPIVFQVRDCSENPETFEVVGLNDQTDKHIDRLPDETIEAMSDRWMDTYYTPDMKARGVVPVLWCTYSRDPVPAGKITVTNAKVV